MTKTLNTKNLPPFNLRAYGNLQYLLFNLLFCILITIASFINQNNFVIEIVLLAAFASLYFIPGKLFRYEKKLLSANYIVLLLSYFSLQFLLGGNNVHSLFPVILFVVAEGVAALIEKGSNIKRTFIFGSLYFLVLMLLAAVNINDFTFNTGWVLPEAALTIFIITVITSSAYNIFPKLLGSYIIPIISGVLIYLMLFKNYEYLNHEMYIAFLIAFVVAFLSMKLKFLTIDGSLAQFILAVFIFGFGGIKWTVPIVVFFISSSLISKLKSENKSIAENYFEKSSTRDYKQVLANGGIGGTLVILNKLFPSELFFWIYVSSLAAVCADTWGTEIGTLFKTKTIDIVNFKLVDQGTSGGVSIPGMLGAVLGAFIIPLSSLSWGRTIYFVSIITVSGVWGSIIDSYIGALFQAQYGCKICGKITERKIHCNAETSLIKGFSRLGNDGVNFISSLLAGITVIFLKEIIRA